MAQALFKDPIVSSGPTRTGTGNGTLTVDRLTHFTTAQTYTLTCIAKSPDTLFSVVGSLDGPVGIAVVGTQFFDDDLKIFLTIAQGATPFEVGDKFVLEVENGTDLNQDNIDDYDEQAQKNFGTGNKGTLSGDNNLRYSEDDVAAQLFLQGLKFVAVDAGEGGNDIEIQYLEPIPAVKSQLTIEDLTFEAVTAGLAGDGISIAYTQADPAVKAELVVQDITFRAATAGDAGNDITVEYTGGGTAGAEVVTVLGNAVSVQIESGVSTATQIKAAIDASAPALALLDATISGTGSNAQTAPVGPTNLADGSDAVGLAGAEVVTVVGNAISVKAEGGVSTAAQIKAALDAHVGASALITTTVSGVGSDPQTIPLTATNLAGGADAIGTPSPAVEVTGDLIKVYFESGVATADEVQTALAADVDAAALVTATVVGPGSERQYSPVAATNLTGGESKYFSFNKHELTEPGVFAEGNASVRMQDAQIQGRASITKDAELSGKVTLKESSSNTVPDLQKYINWLMQDRKVSLRTSDHTKVQWSKPDLSFEADIVIDFNDTGHTNKVAVGDSPVSIPDGSSLYVILDRDNDVYVEPLVAADIPESINAFRIASRFGDNLILWDNTLVRDGKAVRIGEGGEGGTVRVDLYDPVSTTLPSGASATIDGVAVTNNMLVLFSNLSSNNNRIYKASGVGTAITWTAQSSWSTGLDPVLGDDVIVNGGSAFGLSHGIFNGTSFNFNDFVRFFNGTDYWEMSSLKTLTMSASTTDNVLTVAAAGSENMIVEGSIIRGTNKETVTLHITTDGTSVAVTTAGAYIGASGITFSGDISSGDLRLRYTADGSGGDATFKYFVRRWSDSAGGPAGIPSYSGAVSGIAAAGANTQVQFNDGGNFGADSDFTWDKTNNVLGLAGLEIAGLSAPITLLDDASSPATAFQYNAANYPFVIVEFSVKRDGVYQVGRMLIANDGTDAAFTVDFASTGAGTGITFTASISGGNVQVQYLSTATGFNAQMRYSVRRWS